MLVVIHSVTAATRIGDLLPIFQDRRVQLFCTQTSDAVFSAGVGDLMRAWGFLRLTWEEALAVEFDIIVTASLGDNLHELRSPILRLPHGNGYNKLWNEGTEVFGLSDDTLKYDGNIVPASIGLSHSEQFDRLAEDCPDALPHGFVAGDPCYDRILASLPRRLNYRCAFHLRPGQRLITVNSTWKEDSLFGIDPLMASRLLTQLPYDEFRVALVLHPNIWASHSRLQIESWLSDALRAGLILPPPYEGWRAAVVAADWVLSDHGSVGMYAAAVGRPVLLAVRSPEIDGAPPSSLWTHVERDARGELSVRRYPAAVSGASPASGSACLISSDRELDHRLSGLADIIHVSSAELPSDGETWSAAVFEHRPGVRLTIVHDARSARVRRRDGRSSSLVLSSTLHPADAEVVFTVLAERILTCPDTFGGGATPNPLVLRLAPISRSSPWARHGADRAERDGGERRRRSSTGGRERRPAGSSGPHPWASRRSRTRRPPVSARTGE